MFMVNAFKFRTYVVMLQSLAFSRGTYTKFAHERNFDRETEREREEEEVSWATKNEERLM